MVPGPTEYHEDVLNAMSVPSVSHLDTVEFIPILGKVIEMVRTVVMTKTGQPFIVSGACSLGWEMLANLLEKDDEALIVNTGYFGDQIAKWYVMIEFHMYCNRLTGRSLEIYGITSTHLRAPIGDCPSMEELKKAVSQKKYKIVIIIHVDTSQVIRYPKPSFLLIVCLFLRTGVRTDPKRVSAIVKSVSPETLVAVDGVCSVGAEEMRFDDWDLDVVITGGQKGLAAPPGLCVVVVSQYALQVLENRKTPIPLYYANWSHWLPVMKAYEAGQVSYFATPSVPLIFALHQSLKRMTGSPIENRFGKHRQVASDFRKAIRAMGLNLMVRCEEQAANGITTVWLPHQISAGQLISTMASKGVLIGAGNHTEYGSKYFRVGHMGISAMESDRKHIERVLTALAISLTELGYQLE
ncbi:hypothetical protein DFQ30_001046 [Apophysomyces sp. BC1015]|nr:hypothetical protein DFQ30_001046 [Apophysomyces sp. BC1015]